MRKPKNPEIKKKKPTRLERRVRITFFLVGNEEKEIDAVREVINYLDGQFIMSKPELPVTGFTHCAIPGRESVFFGHWWYKTKEGGRVLMIEKVTFFLIDFPALAEEWRIDKNIELLKARIFYFYEKHNCPQKEIWIVKEDIHRYA